MSQDELTFRNLTRNTISILRYELHDHEKAKERKTLFTSIKNTQQNTSRTVTNFQKSGQLFCSVNPFQKCKVEIARPDLNRQILCIFLRIDQFLYQVNLIHTKCHSQYLMATSGNTECPHEHISIYHPQHHHLLVAYRHSYKSWMLPLRSDISLASISIPGTHNSPTYHRALPSVRCQAVPVREQLQNGVRFLDIRVQARDGQGDEDLQLVHGAFPISLTGARNLRRLVNEVLAFLEENPSEVVIMSIKREGKSYATDEQLSIVLKDYYVNSENWFTAPRIPYLGEVRGKIVLIRRFAIDQSLKNEWGGAGWAINGEAWEDNARHTLCPSGQLCIQDFYQVSHTKGISDKIRYAIEHLQQAGKQIDSSASSTGPLSLNFITASNLFALKCWPEEIAKSLNPAIVEYLCLEHEVAAHNDPNIIQGSTGIVICDWLGRGGDWNIVRCIIGMNAALTP